VKNLYRDINIFSRG